MLSPFRHRLLLPDSITDADRAILIKAVERLENPSYAVRLCNVIGTPISLALKLLPGHWYRRLHRHAELCIIRALDLSITHVMPAQPSASNSRRHTLLGMASGALGGMLGAPALLLEMPVTTAIMLSAIADIARSEGEDPYSVDTRLACLSVFALGGRSDADDAADLGYYGLRMALEAPIAEAARYMSQATLSSAPGKAPALVGLIHAVAQRFGVVLTEKTAAEMLPVIGAAGGAISNKIFMDHFQSMARSHFSIRRLERQYSPEVIQDAYQRIKDQHSALTARWGFRHLPLLGEASA